MIEFDQNDRVLNPVVEDAVRLIAADPGEPGIVDVAVDVIHFDAGVTVVHIADVKVDQVPKALTVRAKVVGSEPCIIDNNVVFKRFGQVVVAAL